MYPILSRFILIIFVSLHNINVSLSSRLQQIDPRCRSCVSSNSSNCGTSSIKVGYPFWGNGYPGYCGHPGFELSCDSSNNLTVNIMSETYIVRSIDYKTSTLRIVHEEFSRGNCPKLEDLRNTTLDLTLFDFTSKVQNATLFYNCPSKNLDTSAPFSFFCGKYKNPLSYLVITTKWEHELDKICGVKVYVPVFRESILDLVGNSTDVVDDLLKKGFEVKWVIDKGNCQDCYISGGCCGYNNMSLGQSTCFCGSGSYSKICPPLTSRSRNNNSQSVPRTKTRRSKGLNTEEKIGIGIGALAAGIFIMSILFVVTRSSNENHSSSALISDENSADVYPSYNVDHEEKSSYFGVHLFSYKELERATNKFDPTKELGRGGFGTVYYGKLRDGSNVAIKQLYEKHNKQVGQFMNELEILARLDHRNLVKLYGCTTRSSRGLVLVYEYVPNGTVSDHIHGTRSKPRFLPWKVRLRIAIETASALAYLHASDIIHRDVKSTNILLDINYSVKVVDFGLSRLFPLDVTHVSTSPQGTPGYVDPEYYESYQLTDKSDVYSFGVVMAELLSAKPAVDKSRSREEINLSSMALKKIQTDKLTEFIDPSLEFEKNSTNSRVREEVKVVAEITFRCLQATRDTRPSMEEVFSSLSALQSEDSKDYKVTDISPKDISEKSTISQCSVVVNVSSDQDL